jgi:hypothetical protein
MDKTTLTAVIKLLESNIDRLEDALDAGDNRRIGATIYELRRDLDELRKYAEGEKC